MSTLDITSPHACADTTEEATPMMTVATETSPHTFTTGGPSSIIKPTSHTSIDTSSVAPTLEIGEPSTTMILDLEAPQEQRTLTSSSELLHTLIIEMEGTSSTMSFTSEAPQVVQMSLSDRGQHLPFLKFPRELRDKIYRSLLVWRSPLKSMQPEKYGYPYRIRKRYQAEYEKEVEAELDEDEDEEDEDIEESEKESEEDIEEKKKQKKQEAEEADFGPVTKEGIFLVNQQIRQEAQEIFVKENEFIYEEHIVSYDLGPNGKRKIKRILSEYEYEIKFSGIFKQAREVRAQFSTWGNTLIGDFVLLLLQNPNLRKLHVEFHHPNVPTMKEIRKEMKNLGKVKGLEQVSLSMEPSRWAYRWGPRAECTTKREKALIDFLREMEKKMMAK